MVLIVLLISGVASGQPPSVERNQALVQAAHNGDLRRIKALLDSGADVNAKDYGDGTALMEAVKSGDARVLRRLVEAGADVNARAKAGDTALMVATEFGRMKAVRY